MQILGLSDSTPKPTSRVRELFWPKIDNDVAALTAARNAMYVSFIVAVGTLVFTAGVGWPVTILFLMIGIGTRQFSRVAAVTGLIFYLADFVVAVALGSFGGPFLRAIFTAIFISGVRAAFFANRDEDPQTSARIANPPMDATGVSRFSQIIEGLPQRAWPYIRIPFLLVLVALTALSLFGLTALALKSLKPAAI